MKNLFLILSLMCLGVNAHAKEITYRCQEYVTNDEFKLTIIINSMNGKIKTVDGYDFDRFLPAPTAFTEIISTVYGSDGYQYYTLGDALVSQGYEKDIVEASKLKSYRKLNLDRSKYLLDEDIIALKNQGQLLITRNPSPWCWDGCYTIYTLGICNKD